MVRYLHSFGGGLWRTGAVLYRIALWLGYYRQSGVFTRHGGIDAIVKR
jgi:hypothetical protein